MRLFLLPILLGACALSANATLTDEQQLALRNVQRAMDITDATWNSCIKGTPESLYLSDTYDTAENRVGGISDVWPYTAAIEAHCSILEALDAIKDIDPELFADNFNRYQEQLEQLIDNLEYYRGTYRLSSYATSNKECSPLAVPRSWRRGGADVSGILNVYDDQMWLARELIRAYRVTGNSDYLDEATYLTDYVLEGWDCWRDADGNEYGGITWGPGYNSKHACSNAPIIQPLVWLSDIYSKADSDIEYYYRDNKNSVTHKTRPRSEHYLEFARKVYDWQKDKMLHSSGVYWDMLGAATGDIQVQRGYRQHVDCGGPVGNFYSYNTGTMIAGGAELYRVTGNETYREDLSNSAKGSMNKFSKYVRKQQCYEFNTDETARNGFNTWFNDVLMRGLADAAPYCTNTSAINGLNGFQTTLDYAYDNHRRGGLMPIHLLDGWGDETVTKGFHQFAFASQYAVLAQWLLKKSEAEAGVSETLAPAAKADESTYTLSGLKVGNYSDVRDTLTNGIYIVGGRKLLVNK